MTTKSFYMDVRFSSLIDLMIGLGFDLLEVFFQDSKIQSIVSEVHSLGH